MPVGVCMEKTTFVILPQCKALNGKWSYDNARLIHKIRVFIQLYLCTYLQHHCRAGSVHGRMREVGRGRVGGVGRGAGRGAVKLNLEEVLREEQSYTRERTAGKLHSQYCYCTRWWFKTL